jgi:hypothetical protein
VIRTGEGVPDTGRGGRSIILVAVFGLAYLITYLIDALAA